MKKTVICVTCDHRTVSAPSHKGYEHTSDPVPVLISGGKVVNDRSEKFDEKQGAPLLALSRPGHSYREQWVEGEDFLDW